jgi:hypothetical protein
MKLLAFPGGGAMGAYQAEILQRVDPPLMRLAGAAAGTSIGSVMALAVGFDKTVGISDFFRVNVGSIFGGYRWRHYLKYPLPRYGDKALNDGLKAFFGKHTLFGESRIPLWIVAVHASGRPKVFYSQADDDAMVPAWEVARASCAAPTYFQRWRGKADGGVVANNPIFVGIAGLVARFGYAPHQIRAFKIGTGRAAPIDEEGNDLDNAHSPLTWTGSLRFVMNAHFEGAADAMQDYFAEAFLPPMNLAEIDFNCPPGWDMDDPRVAAWIPAKFQKEITEGAERVAGFLGR